MIYKRRLVKSDHPDYMRWVKRAQRNGLDQPLLDVVVEDKKIQEKSPSIVETPGEVWREFLDETELVAIKRTFEKKSFLWMVASVLCVTMGILQSWRVAQEYFGNKSLQRLLVTNRKHLPFPSVTVCSNILLPPDFDFTLIPNYNTSVHEISGDSCDAEEEQENWEKVMEQNDHRLIEYLRELPANVRMNYSIPIGDFLLSCKIGEKDCDMKSEVHFDIFNNAMNGNCFTVNPAFQSDGYQADVGDRLTLDLKMDSSGHRLHSGDIYLPVLIHAPGTAPILTLPSAYDLHIGRHVTLAIRLTEKLFVDVASADKRPCVKLTNDEYRRRSIFYSDNSPYMYSIEACMATCEQKYYKENCGVIDATFPVQSSEYEKTVIPAFPPVHCPVPDLDMHLCDCPMPCQVLQYSYTPDTTEAPVPVSRENMDCDERTAKNINDADGGNPDAPPVKMKQYSHRDSQVSIYFTTNIYETTSEELEHSFSQFLGILGGNISLWAGICVLSLLEIVDLAIRALIACYKTRNLESTEPEKREKTADEDGQPLAVIQSTPQVYPRNTQHSRYMANIPPFAYR